MSIQDTEQAAGFSWLDPHPTFVILLVGPDEKPFGIQKDFLCAKSAYYRNFFSGLNDEALEYVVKLPKATEEVFGLAQNFLYTGKLSDTAEHPGYDTLVATWKLANQLDIEGLREEALEAMTEYRRITRTIPATPLLIQVWNDTPEGSDIRQLLLTWAAEYIRSSESRTEFSKSLPQELLSELVVAMSHLNSAPVVQGGDGTVAEVASHRKNVHYLDGEDSEGERREKAPKHRHSDTGPGVLEEPKPTGDRKPRARTSLPSVKYTKARKASLNANSGPPPSKESQLIFCNDLLTRMLSGPGYWTRLVGAFSEPVNPIEDKVEDYFDKISKPMDLGTIRKKMNDNEYHQADEFAADVRQIFENCFTYWKEGQEMYELGRKFQKTFEEKYAGMNKWIAKYDGEEPN
ncbi:hypothetical protein SUNI508_04766 [Seiridium unicorne]|uniref:Uncharacterized protein n=1 Tax=Seiridium unicorne TaxID=138068 RepID=A0ABR2V679_9PEZI